MPKHRTPIEQWLHDRGLKKARFAELNGISRGRLAVAIRGECPSIETAHAIVAGTGGDIDYNILFAPHGKAALENLSVGQQKKGTP